MSTMKQLVYTLSILTTILLFTSCTAFEKEPEYSYQVYNNTTYAITVKAKIKYADFGGNLTEVISGGETRTVWVENFGDKGDGVTNIESINKTISVFSSFLAQMDAVGSSKNLLETKRWVYKEEKNYQATYTLTISGDDF